ELAALLPAGQVDRLATIWEQLELDEALFDGGSYRYRRYGRLLVQSDSPARRRFTPLPHVAFRQSAELIPGYGGRDRLFGPIAPEALLDPALVGLVAADLATAECSAGRVRRW